MKVLYDGDLTCRLTPPTGKEIMTKVSVDKKTNAQDFSPVDLAVASLGFCMLTVMAMAAERHQINLKGSIVEVEKEMAHEPTYHIGKITVNFKMVPGIDPAKRILLEKTAKACPVGNSFHPDVKIVMNFKYPD